MHQQKSLDLETRKMARHFQIFLLAVCHLTYIVVCFAMNLSEGDKCVDNSGRSGTCTPVRECPMAMKLIKQNVNPILCGFKLSEAIVCCGNVTATESFQPSKPAEETAKYWCQEYLRKCSSQLIIVGGGRKVEPNEFPHMAAIGYGEPDDIKWSCGGTLISANFVLTAAHCLHSGKNGPARWVLLATELLINTTTPDGSKGQIHPVERRIRHPGYKPPSKYHDVALLELGRAVTPNSLNTVGNYLYPACLPTNDKQFPKSEAIVTGWGAVGHGEDGSPELLKVEIDILETSICNKTYDVEIRTTDLLKKGIDETMICAGVLAGGKDTCKGDSGGPLQTVHNNTCVYTVWGITSFGKVCTFENTPAVYMRVSEYIPWIVSIVWP